MLELSLMLGHGKSLTHLSLLSNISINLTVKNTNKLEDLGY